MVGFRNFISIYFLSCIFPLLGCNAYDPSLINEDAILHDSSFDEYDHPDSGLPSSHLDSSFQSFSPVTIHVSDPIASDLDLSVCSGGFCFWSDLGDEGECGSTGLPYENWQPDTFSEFSNENVEDLYLALSRIWIGKTLLDGTIDSDAWRTFGLDLDGLCSSVECTPNEDPTDIPIGCESNSPQVPVDGEHCRDNAFSRLHPIASSISDIGNVFGFDEEILNCELHRGSYSMILKISEYNGQPNDDKVRLDFYPSGGLFGEMPLWTCPIDNFYDYPHWLPSREWLIDEESLDGEFFEDGTLPNSKTFTESAYVRNGYLISRHEIPVVYRIASGHSTFPGLVLVIQNGFTVARIERTKDATWKLKDGILAGRISKEDMLQSFRQVGFCPDGDSKYYYDSFVQYINDNADILLDETNDPNEDCDALSIGIGFESSQITPGPVGKLNPIVDCCLEENMNTEFCKVGCGDGILFASERCDTGIPEGEPGACPIYCKSENPCIISSMSGEDCDIRCRETEITELIDDDGCCPSGSNANSDSDCYPICGNDIIESGETCDPLDSCPSEIDCIAEICQNVDFSGDESACTSLCEISEITNCVDGDNCCPIGCINNGNPSDENNDIDCPEEGLCGNTLLDSGETCDSSVVDGPPCPESPSDCNDGDVCTKDTLAGDVLICTARCTNVVITQLINDDNCCPEGANYNTDNDCEWECGNNITENPHESCDDGNTSSFDGCSSDCQIETSQEICTGLVTRDYTSSDCRDCICQNCTDESLECFYNYSQDDNQLCINVIECATATCCAAEECYCGEQSIVSCLLFGGNGPCKTEIQAAAHTQDILEISNRQNNPAYPIGRTNSLISCLQLFCADECLICE